ncbi:type II secretion system protein GspD [Thermotoga profunda]|uniref:type II secretion system protein GspD n=1 Tax=Thermotoga profunda TaxID=1508420 RepID=UPI000596F67E|nr:type II secretion system protein GspD [Thermotoga profunda]
MKKTLALILVLLIAIAYGAQITSIGPSFQDGQVIFRIDTDASLTKDNIFVEKNAAGSLVSIHLKNVNLANSPFFLPVAYGPVDSLRAIGTYQGSLVLFQLLIPREPSIEIAGKTLKVAFKGSDKRIDLALTEGSNLETAVKFLSEELNLNVVLSDTVKTAKLALKLSNITPEEALRNLLLTIKIGTEPLAYSYMPDGTLHIGTKKEISQRFAQFWGIYEVSEDIVQKIEKILSPTTIMTYLPNKALLFVYGDIYEQELISKILSVAPPSVTREITVSVPVEDVSRLLTSLKNVYTFEFNLLEGLDKFIITGDSKTVQTVVNYIMQLEERFKKTKIELPTDQATKTTETQTQSKQLKVIYPQEASRILENIGLQVIELPFGVLEIKGSEIQLQLAEAVLRDLGFTEQIQVEPLNIPKPIQEKVISALSTVFGVPISRFVDLQDGLFIIAPLEIRNAIRSIASELTRFYYTLKQSEVFFLNDEQTATQVSQILNQIYGIESITVQNILKVTGSEEDLNKTKTFLKTFVKDRLIRTVNVAFDDQTYTEVKTLIESTFDVRIEANLKSLRRVIISSYNQENLQKAIEELQKIYSLITPIVPQKVVKLIPIVQKLSFEDAKLMLSKLYEIELEKTELFYIITGTEEKIREASDFLEGIRKSLQEEETYTIVRVPEDFALKDISDILSKIAQINIYTADQIMILHGEKKAIEKAQILLDEIQSVLPKIKPEESKPELVARVLEYKEEIPVDEFQSFLQSIGNTVKISAYPKLGIIVISGPSLDVEKAILEYEKFSEKLKQKAEILKAETQPIQVRKNSDGTVSIVCDDKSLKEVITAVAQTLEVSLIFVSTPSENITMNVSSMNWEQFKKLIQEQYGYSFVETDSATVFIKPKVEVVVDRTLEQKFIYNLPHNLDKVKSMVEFYGGKVYVDDLKDLIIITGLNAEAKERVEQLMVDISKPLKQVEIEARLIDRSLLDSLERSFSFGFSLAGTDTSVSLTDGTLNITTNVINMFDYQQLLSLIPKASLSVNANLSDSNTLNSLLASPRIVTSSGQEARILIGDRIPYQTVDAEGNVTVNFLDTGIELKITPYVRMDNTIELSVFTKVSKATYYPNIDIPGESTREAQTKVIIKNGDTLVIGGLIRETDEQTHSKVPILGDLPFIGQLFRTKTDEKDKRELIIFITAKVIEQ